MKIYQNTRITDESKLRSGCCGMEFSINFVELSYDFKRRKDILVLGLRREGKDNSYALYELKGKRYYDKFFSDAKCKSEDVENLLGKKVLGFCSDSKLNLQGIALLKKCAGKSVNEAA